MFIIYLDKEKRDEVYEMYTFKFSYSGDNRAHCQVLQVDKEMVTDEQLYNSTQSMLRTIIVILQGNFPQTPAFESKSMCSESSSEDVFKFLRNFFFSRAKTAPRLGFHDYEALLL